MQPLSTPEMPLRQGIHRLRLAVDSHSLAVEDAAENGGSPEDKFPPGPWTTPMHSYATTYAEEGRNLTDRVAPRDDTSFPRLEYSEIYHSGIKEAFRWQQNREAVYIYVPLPQGTTKRDLDVDLEVHPYSLRLCLNGDTIIDDSLSERVRCDGVFWTLDEEQPLGTFLTVSMEKKLPYQNWQKLLESDPTPELEEGERERESGSEQSGVGDPVASAVARLSGVEGAVSADAHEVPP
ncbi:unnamed protein product [Vitrella brassicaformis CCMP3155]|uniref:CS domain-containing protein n=1 Tax=Vitrella brassicaformis (strain CCMP3155) TaxID=1169540 RepID=A0A0G4GKM7_VITBC|nr:unnamed protein product [Vitrella brassicaformis CCMP3155]|eukprot:CEM30592.1 unnamed protein product [Vitrella brassicaformis CCMP3155]